MERWAFTIYKDNAECRRNKISFLRSYNLGRKVGTGTKILFPNDKGVSGDRAGFPALGTHTIYHMQRLDGRVWVQKVTPGAALSCIRKEGERIQRADGSGAGCDDASSTKQGGRERPLLVCVSQILALQGNQPPDCRSQCDQRLRTGTRVPAPNPWHLYFILVEYQQQPGAETPWLLSACTLSPGPGREQAPQAHFLS